MGNSLERSYRLLRDEAARGQERMVQITKSFRVGKDVSGHQKRSLLIAMDKHALIRPAAMLAAMAIECFFKAVIARHKEPPAKNHDLLKLAQQAGFKPMSPSERALLKELTKMVQLGRYHTTKKGESSFEVDSRQIDDLLKRVEAVTSHVVPEPPTYIVRHS